METKKFIPIEKVWLWLSQSFMQTPLPRTSGLQLQKTALENIIENSSPSYLNAKLLVMHLAKKIFKTSMSSFFTVLLFCWCRLHLCSPVLLGFWGLISLLSVLKRCFPVIRNTTSFFSVHWNYRSFRLHLSILVITTIMILSLTKLNMANQYRVLALQQTMNETVETLNPFYRWENKAERNYASSKWKWDPDVRSFLIALLLGLPCSNHSPLDKEGQNSVLDLLLPAHTDPFLLRWVPWV